MSPMACVTIMSGMFGRVGVTMGPHVVGLVSVRCHMLAVHPPSIYPQGVYASIGGSAFQTFDQRLHPGGHTVGSLTQDVGQVGQLRLLLRRTDDNCRSQALRT